MKRFFSRILRFFWSWGFLKFVLFSMTLVVLLYVEEDWRGARAWAATKAKWEARGVSFDFNAYVPPPVPDDLNLAALPIFDLELDTEPDLGLEVVDVEKRMLVPMQLRHALDEQRHGGMLPSMGESPGAIRAGVETAYKSVFKGAVPPASTLAQFDALYPIIAELRTASATHPYCRFKADYSVLPPFERPFSLLTEQIGVAKKVAFHARLALRENKPDLALSDIELNLRLADGVEKDPTLVAGLVTIGMVAINRGVIEEGLTNHAWNDAQLAELQSQLAKFDFLSGYQFTMRGETITGSMAMLDYVKGLHQKGKTLGGENERVIDDEMGFKHWPGGWLDLNKSQIVDFEFRVLAGVDPKERRVHPEVLRNLDVELQHDEAIPRRFLPWNILFAVTMRPLTNAQMKFAQAQVSTDQALVACALERYRLANGAYPAALDVLTPQFIDAVPHDVMNGEPYRYRLNADGTYLLYSVGWNQRDDGGIEVKEENGVSRDYTKGDWLWPMPKR
jgi:hypothetical protein